MGLLDTLLPRGSSHSILTLRSLDDTILGTQDIVGLARKQTGFGYLRIKRTDLLEGLLEAVHKVEIPVHYNKQLTAIEENKDGVTVTFSDGTTDTADLLLGCDGIHSSVRRLYVDPAQIPEYSGNAGLSSLVPTSVLTGPVASQVRGLNSVLTQEGMFTVMTCTKDDDEIFWGFSGQVPLPKSGDSRDGWEVHHKEDVAKSKSHLLELLQDARGEWGGVMKQIIEKTSVIKFYPVYILPFGGTWFKGRCLLLGDAAHAMQPSAGQGTSMALEDAFLISRLLEDQTRSLGDIYKKFDQIRRPRTDEIADLAGRNAEMRNKAGPVGLWVKEKTLWAFTRVSGAFGWEWGFPQKHLIYDIDEEKL